MRRHSGAGGKPVKTRRHKTATPKRRYGPKAVRRRISGEAGRETEIARLSRELNEAREQETAAAKVLRIISSLGDLQAVFAVILENATRLCQANFGTLLLCEGNFYRQVAFHNAPPAFVEARRHDPMISMTGDTALGRLASTKRYVQICSE
jgi:hypothetical protein